MTEDVVGFFVKRLAELRDACARAREHELECIIITIPMRRHRGRRVRVAPPNLCGTVVGSMHDRLLVSTRIDDVERYMKHIDEALSSR